MLKGLRIRVGNGRGTRFFMDKWLPRETSFRLISPCINGADLKVSDFITSSKQWDIQKLRQYVIEEDLEAIGRILLSWSEAEDASVCHYDRRGVYSVKSGYKLGMNLKDLPSSSSNHIYSGWWKCGGSKIFPPKLKCSFGECSRCVCLQWNS